MALDIGQVHLGGLPAPVGPQDVHLRGHFPERGTSLSPTCPMAVQFPLRRAHHVFPHPLTPLHISIVCVLDVHPVGWHVHHPGRWVGIGVVVGDAGLTTCSCWPTYPTACAGGYVGLGEPDGSPTARHGPPPPPSPGLRATPVLGGGGFQPHSLNNRLL